MVCVALVLVLGMLLRCGVFACDDFVESSVLAAKPRCWFVLGVAVGVASTACLGLGLCMFRYKNQGWKGMGECNVSLHCLFSLCDASFGLHDAFLPLACVVSPGPLRRFVHLCGAQHSHDGVYLRRMCVYVCVCLRVPPGHFLGTFKTRSPEGCFLPFDEALAFARTTIVCDAFPTHLHLS